MEIKANEIELRALLKQAHGIQEDLNKVEEARKALIEFVSGTMKLIPDHHYIERDHRAPDGFRPRYTPGLIEIRGLSSLYTLASILDIDDLELESVAQENSKS